MKNKTTKKEWLDNYASNLVQKYGVPLDTAKEEAGMVWAQVVSIYHSSVGAVGGSISGKKHAQSGHLARIAKLPRKRSISNHNY